MTPRRSSRAARTSQPLPTTMQHTNSSSSSNSLTRAERSTRSNNKIASPRRSSVHRSQSIDDDNTSSRTDLPQTRHRQQRGQGDDENGDDNDDTLPLPGDEYDEEEGDEEEITRCICGQQEYPGLPLIYREAHVRKSGGGRDEARLSVSADASDAFSDDAGSLFIQCDSCKVWQHGGCVGIMDEAACPEEYFCEECRKDLHKVSTATNGQKASRYIPVVGSPTPPSSRASSRDIPPKARDKKSKYATNASSTKRRSTMNSRDAAYDEGEQLRRAIEESKEDSKSVIEDSGTRRGKRSRSDSEANKQAAKRQRTSSPSTSSLSKQSRTLSQPPSDDESKSKAPVNGNKKPRGPAARNQRDKESSTTEKESDKPMAESTGRRKGRSERRKEADDEPIDAASPTKTNSNAPAPTPSVPDTPKPASETATTKPATRKSGRPPARRGRLGRNQYTRDRDPSGSALDSPRRGQSRESGDSPTGGHTGPNGLGVNGGESGKPSKPKYLNPHRTTMNEMKRRVAGILEFISQMQVDMAASGERTTPPNGSATTTTTAAMSAKGTEDERQVNGAESTKQNSTTAESDISQLNEQPKEADFKDLTSVEMMDVLTRNLLKWQQEFGKYGEK